MKLAKILSQGGQRERIVSQNDRPTLQCEAGVCVAEITIVVERSDLFQGCAGLYDQGILRVQRSIADPCPAHNTNRPDPSM
jgi:hypothetical protein